MGEKAGFRHNYSIADQQIFFDFIEKAVKNNVRSFAFDS